MLESGEATSLKEIATRVGIDNSYVRRMVNRTTLAPDIVAAILDDALPSHITLFDLAVDPPALWDEQRERVGLLYRKSTSICRRRPRAAILPTSWKRCVGTGCLNDRQHESGQRRNDFIQRQRF
jgi:hypothetical protein